MELRVKRPLYCVVRDASEFRQFRPDMGHYSPKQLAAKEDTTPTSVYSWISQGLPVMRTGVRGNIRIYYQDFVQWMIECARSGREDVRDVPPWAYRFVKAERKRRAGMRIDASDGQLSFIDDLV